MCGIAGLAGYDNNNDCVAIVDRMCDTLSHRGPDDKGLYCSGGAILGQTRLSIIDLDSGHQPLSNENGSVWITFNGEIYNYRELREDLLERGHRLSTCTDTEVIVHLYEECGIDLIHKLNGMFAFALWDEKQQLLFLVRDRMGIKPLYYAVSDRKLAFASELKALLQLDGLSRDIDREAIAEYLTLGYIPEPRTPFTAIRKLEPASFLRYSRGELRRERYWSLASIPPSSLSIPQIHEQLRFLVEDAVRLQLRSDVPVGVYASGGIDSTLLMWAASQQEVSLEAFLMEFEDLSVDTEYARIAANSTKMHLNEEHLSMAGALELLPKLIWHLDEPLADPAVVPCYLIAKQAAGRVKVILNGTGGDEIFGGYPRYRIRGALPEGWSRAAAGVRRYCGLNPFVSRFGAGLDYGERYYRRLCHFPEGEVRTSLGLEGHGSVHRRIEQLLAECDNTDPSGAMMHVDLNLYLPGDLFMLLDKMTMAASLEARVPLLDHRLVEMAASLPGPLKIDGVNLKLLIRDAFRGDIPDAILDRPKQGFGPPISRWFGASFGHHCSKFLQSPEARISHLFSPKWLRVWLHSDKQKHASRLWSLLVLELWWRTFVDNLAGEQCHPVEIVRDVTCAAAY